jgi:hypothetical protein
MFTHRTLATAVSNEIARLEVAAAVVAGSRLDAGPDRRGQPAARAALVDLERGLAYEAEGRVTDARSCLDRAWRLVDGKPSCDPEGVRLDREIHFHFGRLLREQTDNLEHLARAVLALVRAQALAPDDSRIAVQLSRATEAQQFRSYVEGLTEPQRTVDITSLLNQ